MGQIIGSAAKPKRCNANQLSQVPTPAAGEHILVSSDNSMNAAGQGNFDCYIVGEGNKAATALELKEINTGFAELYTKLLGEPTETFTPTTNGYYLNGSLKSSTSYMITSAIQMRKGDVLYASTAGNLFDVFTKEVGSTHTRILYVNHGSDSTLTTYTYTATEDTKIIVTTKNSPTPSVVLVRDMLLVADKIDYTSDTDTQITNVKEALDKVLNDLTGDISYTATNDGYYNAGSLSTSSNYKYTERIKMKSGDKITIKTAGSSFDVLTNATTIGSYSRLVRVSSGNDTTLQTFTYTAPNDMYVIVTTKNTPTPSIVLETDTLLKAESIKYDNSQTTLEGTNVQSAIDDIAQGLFGIAEKIEAESNGFYYQGTKRSSSNYGVSAKVLMNAGEKIVAYTAGSGFDVFTDATTEGSYTTLLTIPQDTSGGMDSVLAKYEYIAKASISVIVTMKYSPEPSVMLVKEEGVGSASKIQINGDDAYFGSDNVQGALNVEGRHSSLSPVWQRDEFFSGFHLDCGRKYFSPANIKLLIDYLSDTGVKVMELHFSEDEGFRFALDDMNVEANGTTYDLSVCLGEGINRLGEGDGSGKYLTQTEMTDIIAYAKANNVEIAPSFDMPGHMGCILKDFPQFKYDNYSVNFKNAEAVNFAFAIAEKYAKYFSEQGCHIYNICADEVSSFLTLHTNGDIVYFARFVNGLVRLVSSYGMIPQVFSDCVCYDGHLYPVINRSVDVLYYYEGASNNPFGSVPQIVGNGYKYMVNSSNSIYYIIGSTYLTPQRILAYDPHVFKDGTTLRNPHGALFCAWCDNGSTHGQDDGDTMVEILQPLIEAFGQTLVSHMVDSNRPVSPSVGDSFFDTKLKKPIWWDGSVWIDAEGNNV